MNISVYFPRLGEGLAWVQIPPSAHLFLEVHYTFMTVLTGLVIIIIGLLIYSTGSQILTPYVCPKCGGWNKFNPICQIEKQGCKTVIPTFLGFGLVLVGLIVMVRK